jgi:hypothetical protein
VAYRLPDSPADLPLKLQIMSDPHLHVG